MDNHNHSPILKFGVSTSLVLFGFQNKKLKILIINKEFDPFKGAWVLPSKYVKPEDSIENTLYNMLEEFKIPDYTNLEQLKAFTKVFRNPDGRIINVSFYALIKLDDDIKNKLMEFNGKWFNYNKIPDLAYDHNEIIDYAKERLKRRVKRRPIGFYLLPEKFTISQLQNLYEQALNKEIDKRNFRKKIFKSELIIETDEEDTSSKKPAKLYEFDKEKYEKLTLKGYDFIF